MNYDEHSYNTPETEKENSDLENKDPRMPENAVVTDADTTLAFAEKFSGQGGKFVYAEQAEEMIQLLSSLKKEKGWNHVFAWEMGIRRLFEQQGFQTSSIGFFLDNSDVGISYCHSLIAEKGVVFLSPDQASNRRLPSFPKTHIVLAYIDQVHRSIQEAFLDFKQKHSGKLPSLIELSEELPVYQHFQKELLLAHGTKDIYVFLIDQLSPK